MPRPRPCGFCGDRAGILTSCPERRHHRGRAALKRHVKPRGWSRLNRASAPEGRTPIHRASPQNEPPHSSPGGAADNSPEPALSLPKGRKSGVSGRQRKQVPSGTTENCMGGGICDHGSTLFPAPAPDPLGSRLVCSARRYTVFNKCSTTSKARFNSSDLWAFTLWAASLPMNRKSCRTDASCCVIRLSVTSEFIFWNRFVPVAPLSLQTVSTIARIPIPPRIGRPCMSADRASI